LAQLTVLTPEKIEQFAEIFLKNACNVTMTCKAINVSRTTWYEWLKVNEAFKKTIDETQESLIEMAESQLFKNILAGKETSLIFFLLNRASDRWKDKRNIEMGGTLKLVKLDRPE